MKTIRLAMGAFLVAGVLTLLAEKFTSAFFFYALYPGMILGLLIHGGHGGTEAEEMLGLVLGLVVNFLTYYLLFLLVARLSWNLRGRLSK